MNWGAAFLSCNFMQFFITEYGMLCSKVRNCAAKTQFAAVSCKAVES